MLGSALGWASPSRGAYPRRDAATERRTRDLAAALDADVNLTAALVDEIVKENRLDSVDSRVAVARLAATALARLPDDSAPVAAVRDTLVGHVGMETLDWLLQTARSAARAPQVSPPQTPPALHSVDVGPSPSGPTRVEVRLG